MRGEAFKEALQGESSKGQRALLMGFIANTLGAQKHTEEAIKMYREAEPDYPEGGKYIFSIRIWATYYRQADSKTRKITLSEPSTGIRMIGFPYLNLALVYDEEKMWSEAQAQYEIVRAKSDANFRAAQRRQDSDGGRSAELAGHPPKKYVALYLEAAGHASSEKDVKKVTGNPQELASLYQALAQALVLTNTQGIEKYIEWFQEHI